MKVLVLAYFFPPLGGAGVQRTLKFVRYLPEYGWHPEVISVRRPRYWIRDPTLSGEIPRDVAVHRVANPVPLGGSGGGRRRSAGTTKALRWLATLFLVPDVYSLWSRAAASEAARLLRYGGFDALLTTSSPDSAHAAGLSLKTRFGLPWVADFRDPWVRRLSFAPPTPLHRRIHLRMEETVLRRADRIVVTSRATKEDFVRRNAFLNPDHVHIVTNGFDEHDFSTFETELSGDRFRILHLGQLNPERSLLPLLRPLAEIMRRRPDMRGRVEVLCIGPHYETHARDAARAGLGDTVRFLPPCTHEEGIAWLGRAHLLLLLEQEGERGRLILPGKTFEYLRSGRPVLGLVDPEGDAARLLEAHGAGWAVPPGESGRVASCLEDRWNAFASGATETGADPARLGDYERKHLTRDLARILTSARRG